MIINLPDRPSGTAQQQINQLWEYLYKLAEQLQIEEQKEGKQ